MGLIKKVSREERETLSIRLEVGLLDRLNRYAKYLGGPREYVISEALKDALKLADAKDQGWIAYSTGVSSSSNGQLKGKKHSGVVAHE